MQKENTETVYIMAKKDSIWDLLLQGALLIGGAYLVADYINSLEKKVIYRCPVCNKKLEYRVPNCPNCHTVIDWPEQDQTLKNIETNS